MSVTVILMTVMVMRHAITREGVTTAHAMLVSRVMEQTVKVKKFSYFEFYSA